MSRTAFFSPVVAAMGLFVGCGGSGPKTRSPIERKDLLEQLNESGQVVTCQTSGKLNATDLENVRGLRLEEVSLEPAACSRLEKGRLEAVALFRTRVSQDVIERLAGLQSLRYLSFQDCKISPDDWATLKASRIEELILVDDLFDDAALDAVGTMPNLRRLRYGSPKVSDAAIKRFEKTRPKIELDLLSW